MFIIQITRDCQKADAYRNNKIDAQLHT